MQAAGPSSPSLSTVRDPPGWYPDTRESSNVKSRPTQLHHGATRATVAPMPSPYPAARIAVDDDAWRAFRQAALVRGIPVSVYLARLVEAELGRRSDDAGRRGRL